MVNLPLKTESFEQFNINCSDMVLENFNFLHISNFVCQLHLKVKAAKA